MKRSLILIILLIFQTLLVAQSKEVVKINCDSIFNKRGYSVSLEFDPKDQTILNVLFTFSKKIKGKEKIIHQERLHSQFQNVEFIDFNGDGIKDILIENTSDVRSNLTYNLFIVDFKNQNLRKIEGFDEIKNPNYLKEYDLIDCLVMSGKNWTSFYKIEGNKIKDLGYVIQDGEDDNGKDLEYDKNYELTLAKILKSEKERK
ncbi:XAC2610-related protein [Epilithonimonas hungarica]|uniref:VCBS repeat-containing protein n=1 Tax=Epilithonimonas hungarica TaxID=454006 RepID=A0A1G7FWP4_9FLAO|nr:hypothetical protein [Epilithonimonas hungarica]SDE80314.1 hypothetical protein SAMN05421825_0246 [Epilithonimonas hungarica]